MTGYGGTQVTGWGSDGMCVCVAYTIASRAPISISARNPIEPMMMIADEAEKEGTKRGCSCFLGNG